MAKKEKALISLKPIQVRHSDRPTTFVKPNPRRVLPFIKEGKGDTFTAPPAGR